jgi:hypothetical protein
MSQQIDKFCEDLRLKLTNIESGLDSLKSKMEGKTQEAEKEVNIHLSALQKQMVQDRAKASAASAEVKAWIDNKKAVTAEKVAEWKAKRELGHLQNRADQAERYAHASITVAKAALDEAEQATLEAWLARADASTPKSK